MSKNSHLHTGRLSSKDIERLIAETRAGALKPSLHNHGSVPGLYVDLRNGTSWVQVASPNPGSSNDLNAVAASSPANAWAVGTFDGAIRQALAIHCC